MKKLIKRLFNGLNQNGNILTTAVVIMVVLASSVATVTAIAVQQNKSTTIKMNNTTDENVGMRLIQQSIGEFEQHITDTQDFNYYEVEMIPEVLSTYNVRVVNVTEDFEGFGIQDGYTSYVYRFEYTLNNGNILQMYSYVSTEGSTVNNAGDPITPFNFSIGTNGDLVLTGGYYNNPVVDGENPSFFAENIYLNYQAPYLTEDNWGNEYWTSTPSTSGSYPDFVDDEYVDMYYRNDYAYCGSNCWDYGNADDPLILEKSKFVTVDGWNGETGNYEQDEVVPNFFGDWDFESATFEFITDIGPTDSRIITDSINIDNYYDVIMANTEEPELVTEWVWVPRGNGRNNKGDWVQETYYVAPDSPYTDITDLDDIDFEDGGITLGVSGVYDGDLTVTDGIHLADRDNESIIVTGDLTIDTNYYSTIDGKFVVLGDLIFIGDTIDIDGAFYVFGETRFNFNYDEGITEAGDTSEYGLTIISRDNIMFESMWEGTWHNQGEFDVFLYTEESIYMEAVKSKVEMSGVLFANAKNESGNHIPVVDENGEYINGIVITSYRGYTNWRGNLIPRSNVKFNRFYYTGVFSDEYQEAFVEIPEFESVVFKEGGYTFERSEFSYQETE